MYKMYAKGGWLQKLNHNRHVNNFVNIDKINIFFILCTISSSCFRSSNLSFLASFFPFFPFSGAGAGAGACFTRGVVAALSLSVRPY